MIVKISNYSCGDSHVTETNSENISRIIDKLIRITAKITEHFASDIMYDISALNNAVKLKMHHDVLLFFRECGVTTWLVSELDEKAYDAILTCFIPIQTWRLTHNPDAMETKLIRVNVSKEYF